jgi:hypothetical protein
MWFIPQSPFNDQPTTQVIGNVTNIICLNTTTGTFPEIYLGVNSSFMAALDFTFPSETMQLKFDVKRCTDNVIQYNNWCGKRCYTLNCTIPPRGWFTTRLYDPITDTNIFEFTKEANDNWTTYTVDIGSNVLTDQNYTLLFDVLPLPYNPTETIGNCLYFDNVRLYNQQVSVYDEWAGDIYNLTWSDLDITQKQTVLAEKCVNECIGNNYYSRTVQDLTCIEEVFLNYTICVQQNQQGQNFGNQSIYLPISSIADMIVNTTTNQTLGQSIQAQGLGFLLVFLTPIFWICLFVTIIAGVLTWFSKHMEIGVVGGLLMLLAFTLAGLFPAWLFIILIVIAGYLIGREVVGVVSGK